MELEARSPLNGALESRRWDLVDLLLGWGAKAADADISRILDTYQRVVFDRFWAAGVDLAGDRAMADALANSTRNRPLYGFAKAYRDRDPRIQRALDVALGTASEKRSDKAISLCLWAGADPRHRVGQIGEDIENDEHGMTAFERSVTQDTPEYLRKLGFDPTNDDLEEIFQCARRVETLRALVAIRQPADWTKITERFISSLAFVVRFSIRPTSISELGGVFALGGRLGSMHRSLKADLRYLFLSLDDRDAKRLPIHRSTDTPRGPRTSTSGTAARRARPLATRSWRRRGQPPASPTAHPGSVVRSWPASVGGRQFPSPARALLEPIARPDGVR